MWAGTFFWQRVDAGVNREQLLTQLGLRGDTAWWTDRWLLAFAVSGILAVLVARGVAPDLFALQVPDRVIWYAGSFVLWQPLIEELLFRGLLQGQLVRTSWGHSSVFGVSWANLLTTLLFVAAHTIHQPLLWALAVSVPSLMFGWLRDRHEQIYPALALHMIYNAGFLVACLFGG